MSYANRGKALQVLINHTNKIYHLKGWAVVDEVPVPITITEDKGRYIRGFKKDKSTVDYIGLAGGKGIAFDAKSTRELTRFPLTNVHDHQVEYLERFQQQEGIAFFLVEFARLNRHYFVPLDFFLPYWKAAKKGGRKSIPFKEIETYCYRVRSERGVALDYLKYCC
ncbi:Holliday junction resolvase RecU [Bacillus infantis]|uniref:Holliday junction resolvase RecU n=1 Tax=Bacillus infantis TaxID=324767 RepID=UPI00344C1F67